MTSGARNQEAMVGRTSASVLKPQPSVVSSQPAASLVDAAFSSCGRSGYDQPGSGEEKGNADELPLVMEVDTME